MTIQVITKGIYDILGIIERKRRDIYVFVFSN